MQARGRPRRPGRLRRTDGEDEQGRSLLSKFVLSKAVASNSAYPTKRTCKEDDRAIGIPPVALRTITASTLNPQGHVVASKPFLFMLIYKAIYS